MKDASIDSELVPGGDSAPGAEDALEGCEVCGQIACECPAPLGECCACHAPIFEADSWVVDCDGGHWCLACACRHGGDS